MKTIIEAAQIFVGMCTIFDRDWGQKTSQIGSKMLSSEAIFTKVST